jgi:tetratricopeptide (TPR) repeat protein
MALGLDDALLGWLVASAGGSLVHRLRSDRAVAAMRTVVEEAVEATIVEIASHLDADKAVNLRSLLSRGSSLNAGEMPVSSEAELRGALRTWTAALNRAEFGELGYLSKLGVDPDRLADELTRQILAGISRRGRSGGPLSAVADWQWRGEITASLARIKETAQAAVARTAPIQCGLPGGTPAFTGRQEALARLAEQLSAHDPAGAVVAIHVVDGMAGVGKTELALRVAHQHKHRHPDGQYFLNLHGYTEGISPMPPEAALEELLRQAGVPGQQIPPGLAARQVRWQALMAPQRALILLDNALNEEQVRPLLPMSAGSLVLITSRSRLTGLAGAKSIHLDVLPPQEAIELFTRLSSVESESNIDSVAKIVELVGRLPVALAAVAGQIHDGITVAELAEDLASAISHESRADDSVLSRASVRTALETSLRQLDQAHQRAFRILGLSPGPTIGVPQFAALADVSPTDARRLLSAVTDRNLITLALDQIGHRRYQLHDLVRAFAREQADSHLSTQQRSEALARLAIWYASAISTVEQLWGAGSDAIGSNVEGLRLAAADDARAWLVAEQGNIFALAATGTDADAADVAYRSARLLSLLGHYANARILFQSAVDTYHQIEENDKEADALTGLGHVARLLGDIPAADEHIRNALSIYQRSGNQHGEAYALTGMGHFARLTGDTSAADKHFRNALVIHRRLGNRDGEAEALTSLGDLAVATGDYTVAGELRGDALTIYREVGNRDGEGRTLWGLGQVARLLGDYSAAEDRFRSALTIYQQIGSRDGEANVLSGLGDVARFTSGHAAARDYYRDALAIYSQVGDRYGEAQSLWGLGEVARLVGDYTAARDQFRGALAIYKQVGSRYGEAQSLWGLGEVARLVGDYTAARDQFHGALTIYQQIGSRDGEADAEAGLGNTANAVGQREQARVWWLRAFAIYADIGSPRAEVVRDWLEQVAGRVVVPSSLIRRSRFPQKQIAVTLLERVRTVVAKMQQTTQDELLTDADGNIEFRAGAVVAFVRVTEDPPLVDVFSPVLTDVQATEELHRRLSELTHRIPFGRLYHTGGIVRASVSVLGVDFQPGHLMLAVRVIAELGALIDQLRTEFGGRRLLAEEDGPGDRQLALTTTGAASGGGAADSVAVDAYLDTNERSVAQRVLDALDEIALLLGYEGPTEEQWFNGSIWRRARAIRKNGLTGDEVRSRLVKIERALELAYLDARQADVDARTAEAVTRLIVSLGDVPNACLRVGSILIVKYSEDGAPVVLTRNLSQIEIRALERLPEIQTNPRRVLDALATAIASLPSADQDDQTS